MAEAMIRAVGQGPRRGDIWLVALGAARKGEFGKNRPSVVVSVDGFQSGSRYDLITVVPITSNPRQAPTQLQPRLEAGHGLVRDSVIMCNAPRAVGPSRFLRRLGEVPEDVFDQIIDARSMIEGWDE